MGHITFLPFQALEEAQQAIQELFGRIRNIKAKAEHSELMVRFSPLQSYTSLLVRLNSLVWQRLEVQNGRDGHFHLEQFCFILQAFLGPKSLFYRVS